MPVQKSTKRKHKQHKTPVARKPEEVVVCKKKFLAQLKKGLSPGVAARRVHIVRQTAYNWRNDDRVFDADWKDAVETGLDEIESRCAIRAMKDSIVDAHFLLKHRRYNFETQQRSNVVLNITLEEHTQRLIRLGLPVPQIEDDYEPDDYVDVNNASADHS